MIADDGDIKLVFEDDQGNRYYIDSDDLDGFSEMMLRDDVHIIVFD